MSRSSSSFQIHCISITIFLGICVSALSFNQSDPKGCIVSPDNSGCILNRPVDIEKESEKAYNQSQDLVFLETL